MNAHVVFYAAGIMNVVFYCHGCAMHDHVCVHAPLPRELLRSMGEAGEIEPETQSFLLENDIDSGEFSPEALDCLPQQRPWTIPQVPVTYMMLTRDGLYCVYNIMHV